MLKAGVIPGKIIFMKSKLLILNNQYLNETKQSSAVRSLGKK